MLTVPCVTAPIDKGDQQAPESDSNKPTTLKGVIASSDSGSKFMRCIITASDSKKSKGREPAPSTSHKDSTRHQQQAVAAAAEAESRQQPPAAAGSPNCKLTLQEKKIIQVVFQGDIQRGATL